MNILGIDCGVHGALALLGNDEAIVSVHDMPSVEVRIGKTKRTRVVPATLAQLLRELQPSQAILERLHGMPGMGGSTMFALGYAAGISEGVLAALGLPASFVTPAVWKRTMQVTSDKGTCRQRAMALWPMQADLFKRVKDDGRAEACLIALYGLRALKNSVRELVA